MTAGGEGLELSFLVSTPEMSDGIFAKSVILLLGDGVEGSFGLIVNKPSGSTLSDISPEFRNGLLAGVDVFDGGPMNRNRLTLALWVDDEVSGGNFSFGLNMEKIESVLRSDVQARVCAFLGCASWAPKQLNQEIQEGSWFVAKEDLSTIFNYSPNELWKEMLLKINPQYATLPEAVSTNLN